MKKIFKIHRKSKYEGKKIDIDIEELDLDIEELKTKIKKLDEKCVCTTNIIEHSNIGLKITIFAAGVGVAGLAFIIGSSLSKEQKGHQINHELVRVIENQEELDTQPELAPDPTATPKVPSGSSNGAIDPTSPDESVLEPDSTPTPEPNPEPDSTPTPEPNPEPNPTPTPEPNPTPTPEPNPTPTPIPPHVHNWIWISTVPATCITDGFELYECPIDNETMKKPLPALGHDFKLKEKKQATCTADGYELYECSRDGETNKEILPALGHAFVLKETKQATCTADGYKLYECSRDGETKKETESALGHAFVLKETKQATCTEGGYDLYECSRDGETERRNEVDPLGHQAGSPTEKVEGEWKITTTNCVRCGTVLAEKKEKVETNGTTDDEKQPDIIEGDDDIIILKRRETINELRKLQGILQENPILANYSISYDEPQKVKKYHI